MLRGAETPIGQICLTIMRQVTESRDCTPGSALPDRPRARWGRSVGAASVGHPCSGALFTYGEAVVRTVSQNATSVALIDIPVGARVAAGEAGVPGVVAHPTAAPHPSSA